MKKMLLLVFLVSLSSIAFANSVTTINFEQYSAYTQITTQYAGVDFGSNALQLVVPFYDYFDYPPHSGSGVITNDPNDPITISFSSPYITDVNFWYAAPDGIVASAYNQYGTLIATAVGAPVDGSNLWVDLASSHWGIAWVTISANDGADSETVDDLSYTTGTPEPGSFLLLGSGLLGVAGVLRRKLAR